MIGPTSETPTNPVASDLLKKVRLTDNLFAAWSTVRANVLASGREQFKQEVRKISEQPVPYLRRLQRDLRTGTFRFVPQIGVLKGKKGGSKRGIVVAPIRNRIVQRAILNVLQSDDPRIVSRLGKIPKVLRAPKSVGGIPGRGVHTGVAIASEAIARGATHLLKSDIKSFFDHVPKDKVLEFIRSETNDHQFADFMSDALATELENADEVRDSLNLFPTENIGVPQGSSLSAFAANVVLQEFDRVTNTQDVTTVRYIDDFLMLGPSERALRAVFRKGLRELSALGLSAYLPDSHSDKARLVLVSRGVNFLGCSVRGQLVAPSRDAKAKINKEIALTISVAKKDILYLLKEAIQRRAENGYIQTLALIDRKIRGWGDSYAFCNDRSLFGQLDADLGKMVEQFGAWFHYHSRYAREREKSRATGIALLIDTPQKPLLTDNQTTPTGKM
ncbi:MAG: reverse transcriptase domain-containing protein [Reyranellaceae bacterium]